jgi:hypothetical protein
MKKLNYLNIILLCIKVSLCFEGFGSNTNGGNNGELIIITSSSDNGPGTLRSALNNGSNKNI